MLIDNINAVLERIKTAMSNRVSPSTDVWLVPATKMVDVQTLKKVRDFGITTFGENKVQELVDKYPLIDGVQWHFIGHLQTNKIKYIIDKVQMIHSVDSIKLAEEIDKQAKKHNITMDILMQVNVPLDENKSGFLPQELDVCINELLNFENIRLCGFMTMMPVDSTEDKNSEYFLSLKKIFDNYASDERLNVKYLSMGMSSDYELAIRCGANLVRVGSSIFGKRNYNI